MPVHYTLFENTATTDPTDWAARVKYGFSADLNAVVDRIIQGGGSTLSRGDILATLEAMIVACEGIVLDGGRVNLGGLVELYAKIKGKFTGPADVFTAPRNKVMVGADAGDRIAADVAASATVIKDEAAATGPNLLEFRDLGSNTTNTTITPGNIGTVVGYRLKYNPAAADEGVYFVPTGGGAAVKVAASQSNLPGSQVFLIPTLAAGTYRLQVRARMEGSTQLRTGELEATLTRP